VRWLRWAGYLAFLGAGMAAGFWLTIRFSFAGTGVAVPAVVGMTQDQAKFQAASSRLKFQVLSERFDLNAPRGKVVSQEPPAGTLTRRFRTLGVVVSKGVDRMPMPALVGDRMDQAQVKLHQAGLKLASVAYVHSGGDPQTVVAQDPPGESFVSREMDVSILVSVGPEAMAFVMPTLVGKPYGVVRSALQGYGLQTGTARTVKAPGAPLDTVVAQSPSPGSPLTRRDVIQISVNRP
jgi:eukaryotic-like serine/threonine-protein kinase